MSALTVGHPAGYGPGWDDLVRIWQETDVPEGCKVEIIEGVITVSPSPAKQHNLIAAKVARRLLAAIPDDWNVFQTQAVSLPSRLGMFIPDLVVAAEAELDGPGTDMPAGAAELVVEVTSPSNARHDRISKPAAYATAGIPLYLLIDRWAPGGPTITLYGEPRGDVYRVLSACKFGEPIKLPEPFDLEIDTSAFPVD